MENIRDMLEKLENEQGLVRLYKDIVSDLKNEIFTLKMGVALLGLANLVLFYFAFFK